MSKREIAAIIALMIAGFVAYEVISQFQAGEPDEVAPGETPQITETAGGDAQTATMKALVPAVRTLDLDAAVREKQALPELPSEIGLLAVPGNPGEFFFTRRYADRTDVCVMRAAGVEVLWSSPTDQVVEIVGAHGSELLLKFVDRPFSGPADAWESAGFHGLDMFAAGRGTYPYELDEETIAFIRSTIR